MNPCGGGATSLAKLAYSLPPTPFRERTSQRNTDDGLTPMRAAARFRDTPSATCPQNRAASSGVNFEIRPRLAMTPFPGAGWNR